MKSKNATRVIMAFLIVQMISGVVLALFLYSFLTNPDSPLNRSISEKVHDIASSFSPLPGLKGDKGDIGEKGDQGVQGERGAKGEHGKTGKVGATGNQGLQGVAGKDGEDGERGQQGEAGPRAEWQCNPETARHEYKYPGDEEWTQDGGQCVPVEGGDNEQ